VPAVGVTLSPAHPQGGAAAPAGPMLTELTLSGSHIIGELSAPEAVVGNIGGRASGSTLTMPVDAGGRFKVGGSIITGPRVLRATTALNYEDATSHMITVRETLAGSPNSPRDTSFTINVADQHELNALSLGSDTIAEDATVDTIVGAVIGATPGSTITLHAQSNAGWFGFDGMDVFVSDPASLDYEANPAPSITLREVLAGVTTRDSVITINVTDVVELGDEILVNGDFATDTDWDNIGDFPFTIAAGKLNAPGLGIDSGSMHQAFDPQPAGTYRLVFTIDSVSEGSFWLNFGGGVAASTIQSSADTYSEDIFIGDAFGDVDLRSSGGDAVIDNVSLRKIL
jgi:hypothetical protein